MAETVKEKKPEVVSPITEDDKRDFALSVMKDKTSVLDPVEHAQIKKIVREYWQSGALNDSFKNEQQVLMAIMAGREMGMSFMESINGLYFVGGKVNIYGKATPSALRRHGWQIRYKDETQASCTAVVRNVNTGEEIEDTFTFKEAELSGFTKNNSGYIKFGWKEGANRKRKLRYGVLSQIISTYIPEVIGGIAGVAEYSSDYIEGEAVAKNDTDEKAKAEIRAKYEETTTTTE